MRMGFRGPQLGPSPQRGGWVGSQWARDRCTAESERRIHDLLAETGVHRPFVREATSDRPCLRASSPAWGRTNRTWSIHPGEYDSAVKGRAALTPAALWTDPEVPTPRARHRRTRTNPAWCRLWKTCRTSKCTDIEQISGHPRLRRACGAAAHGDGVSFAGDVRVPGTERGGRCMTLRMYDMSPELCTLKGWVLCCANGGQIHKGTRGRRALVPVSPGLLLSSGFPPGL